MAPTIPTSDPLPSPGLPAGSPAAPWRGAMLGLGLALGLGCTGCAKLCELGAGFCEAPCEATTLPEAWNGEPLSSLVPAQDVTVCEATAAEDGSTATARFWVPGKVHDANMDAVESAQDHGWARIGDNWYGTSGDFHTPKWSEFAGERGELLRIDVRESGGGAQVEVAYKGFAPLPELRGDVTLFTLENGIVAMMDGQFVPLLGIPAGGEIDATSDGFFYASDGRQDVLRYGPDAGVHPHPIVLEGSGQLGKHGVGPDEALWITFDPYEDGKPTRLGHLAGGDWQMEDLPTFDPPLTGHIQLEHGGDGSLWLLGSKSVHVRKEGAWRSAPLPDDASIDSLATRDDGSAVVTAGKKILSVRPGAEGLELTPVGRTVTGRVYGGGDTIVVRDYRRTVLVQGDEVTPLGSMHDDGGGISVGEDGTIAVTHPKKDFITVRTPDGTITRYPEEGSLSRPVGKWSWIDGTGRIYVDSKDQMLVIDDGALKVLPKLGSLEVDVMSVDFMGRGAAPVGLVEP